LQWLFKSLVSLAKLRDTEQFSYKSHADQAIAKATKTYGPQNILEAIPLGINVDEYV
jgi:hypothetical protein